MATKNDVIKLATSELGYLEKSKANWNKFGINCLYTKTLYAGADNVQKYAYEVGHQKNVGWAAWCQSFIAYLFYKSYGKDLANQLLCGKLASASTMEVKNAFVAKKQTVELSKAQPGDIVFRSRSGGGHVGLVVGWENGQIVTVEGNSSSTDITSWNGGAVVRHVGAPWQWCCRPNWALLDTKKEKEPSVYKWVASGGLWYYQDQYGENYHGWAKIKESAGKYLHWYHFGKTGSMSTGAFEVDGKWYFAMPSGDLEGALCITNASGALEVWNLSE